MIIFWGEGGDHVIYRPDKSFIEHINKLRIQMKVKVEFRLPDLL